VKNLTILPICPWSEGVVLRGVPGPLVMLGTDLTKMHPMIQEAFTNCLEYEGLIRQREAEETAPAGA